MASGLFAKIGVDLGFCFRIIHPDDGLLGFSNRIGTQLDIGLICLGLRDLDKEVMRKTSDVSYSCHSAGMVHTTSQPAASCLQVAALLCQQFRHALHSSTCQQLEIVAMGADNQPILVSSRRPARAMVRDKEIPNLCMA